MAYVAEQMEGRGERVDWDYLYLRVRAIAEDLNSPHNLLSALSEFPHTIITLAINLKSHCLSWDSVCNTFVGKSVDDFIEDHFLYTVKNNAADVT